MLYEQRTYFCKVGTIQKHIELYRKHGYAAHTRHVGMPIMFATTEVGELNSYVHVWAYIDADDRRQKREALYNDPDWLEYIRISRDAGYLVKQENRFLQQVDFSAA